MIGQAVMPPKIDYFSITALPGACYSFYTTPIYHFVYEWQVVK